MTRKKIVTGFLLWLFVIQVVLILLSWSLFEIESQRARAYRMGFVAGCQSYALRYSTSGHGEHVAKESHLEFSFLLTEYLYEKMKDEK